MFPTRARTYLILAALLPILTTACLHPDEWRRWQAQFRAPKAQPVADPRAAPKSAALRDTIGTLVTVGGMRLNRVIGYGLVMNLPGTGGSDGPDIVKRHLAGEMRRRQRIGEPSVPANQILQGRDTAIVEVAGLIPAGADKGTRFDLFLRALGEETTSLVGGRLVLCDLVRYAETPRGIISGKKHAEGRGPVFVSPFGREEDAATKLATDAGIVLGGGIVTETRKMQLLLNATSFGVATRIRNRLNSRYGTLRPVARAANASFIRITAPRRYASRRELFINLVLHTTIRSDRAFIDTRVQALAREITHPDAIYDDIALAWEAIGQPALPTIKAFYDHPSTATSYYAARTGMRLGDSHAMEIVARRHAADAKNLFRQQAIKELGYAAREMHRAGEFLRDLLDDPDTRVRIEAYHGLLRSGHPAVQSTVLDADNLILDVVDSDGPHLIFVQRSRAPRIAVFGSQMACRPPVMCRNDYVLITAEPGDKKLKIMRSNLAANRVSPVLEGPLSVTALIRYLGDTAVSNEHDQLRGLSVPFSEIVGVLHTLCGSGAIAAVLDIERPLVTEDVVRQRAHERPESEF